MLNDSIPFWMLNEGIPFWMPNDGIPVWVPSVDIAMMDVESYLCSPIINYLTFNG